MDSRNIFVREIRYLFQPKPFITDFIFSEMSQTNGVRFLKRQEMSTCHEFWGAGPALQCRCT